MKSNPILHPNQIRIFDTRLKANPSRVVLRPFHLGWQAQNAPGGRAMKLVEDINALSPEDTRVQYRRVLKDFKARHWQTEKMFSARFEEVVTSLELKASNYSDTKRKLIGAYFCHE